MCVQGESRETPNLWTPACSNSALLSRRSSTSLVQGEDQSKRKKRNRAGRSSTTSRSEIVSRGANQTVASGTWSPPSSRETSLRQCRESEVACSRRDVSRHSAVSVFVELHQGAAVQRGCCHEASVGGQVERAIRGVDEVE